MNGKTAEKRAAFITGGSYGVGEATALALARNGFDIAVSATRISNLDNTLAQLCGTGVKAIPVQLDLSSQDSIEAAMAEVAKELGTIDVLVNNASTHMRKPAVEITRQDWEGMFSANLTGTFFLTQQFGRQLISQGQPGSVINITSTHALRGAGNRLMYGVAKAALHQVTQMLAIEWAGHGIRVNAIAPGRMLTASPSRQETAGDPQYIAGMLKRIPLGRMATAEDVAEAAAFLVSPGAASITGQVLVIDGGLTVQ